MKKFIQTLILSIFAGIFVAIGGTVFLSVENKIIGAFMFTIGLFFICTRGCNLFTGKVAYVPLNDLKYALNTITIWFGNLIGTVLVAWLISLTRISGIAERAAAMCETKLSDGLLSIFILSIFCNLLIYLAVDGFRKNPHELGKYLALFFGVVVFILCGFEHCVANMFYISMAGMWSGKAVVFIIVNTLGNVVGGMLIPLCERFLLSDS